MKATVGIVGAGILGRLAAWVLARAGMRVTVFEKGAKTDPAQCSSVAAGMLAPVCESFDAPAVVRDLGRDSLAWWRTWSEDIGAPELVARRGTIIVAPERSRGELRQFRQDLAARGEAAACQLLDHAGLRAHEPEFDERFSEAIYIADEGHVEPQAILAALRATSLTSGVSWRFDTQVCAVEPHAVTTQGGKQLFDWVLDMRGWAAKTELKDLMPVRGEILTLESAEMSLNRPVRVLHPRHAIYIVPRPGSRFVVGSTNIPTDDPSAISVRSTLEFLSVAYHVFPALAEARLVATASGVRPAFADRQPRIAVEDGLVRVNGAYRHGYLIGPMLAECVRAHLTGATLVGRYHSLFHQEENHAAAR